MREKFEGRVTFVGDLKSYQGRDGSDHVERTVVVETDDRYPESAAFRLRDNLAKSYFAAGMAVSVSFELRAQQGKSGLYFNELNAWNINIKN